MRPSALPAIDDLPKSRWLLPGVVFIAFLALSVFFWHRLESGDRGGLVQHSTTDPATSSPHPNPALLILWGGSGSGALLALVIFYLGTQRQRAERLTNQVIAALRQSEASLRKADHLKQAVLDAATEVSIIATDTEGMITVFNRGAEKMLGYRPEEMIGKETPARIHLASEVIERSRQLSDLLGHPVSGFATFVTIPDRDGSERREWTYLHRDGHAITVDLVVTAEYDSQGNTMGYLGIAVDISHQKQVENELKRQAKLLQGVIENIPGGLSLIDADLHFIAANQELRKVLDFPESLFANGAPSLHEIALFNARRGEYGPGNPEEQAQSIVDKARHPVKHCFERTRPNGTTLEVRGTPLSDGGFVTIYTDITARKEAEAELTKHRDNLQALVHEQTAKLEEALILARAAANAKAEFLANMSHELRTPMHAILSFSEMGVEKSRRLGVDKLEHYFDRIGQSAERLLELINNLLDLSKLESGHEKMEWQTVDVLHLARQAGDDLESLIQNRHLTLHVAVEDTSTEIQGDRKRIAQVVHNLLSNAIKFSPDHGAIAIALRAGEIPSGRRATDTERLPALVLTLTDAGPGIPEDELESVFDKFVQSSKTRTGAGGTGLGLAICREIVHAHRGTIVATNVPQGGACLTVTLPLEQSLEVE